MQLTSIKYSLYAIWAAVLISFFFGISLPIATVKKFYFFENNFSLLGSLRDLLIHFSGQNVVLFIIIFLFTIVFPVAKLITMFLQIKHLENNWQNKITKFIEAVGHFSMIDVFIIALMVLLLKLGVMVEVEIHYGFYVFSFSIIFSIILSFVIKYIRDMRRITDE